MTECDRILALCHKAGVLPNEMRHDPVHGLCVSTAGVRKLAVLAPDQDLAARVVKVMEEMTPAGLRGVQ